MLTLSFFCFLPVGPQNTIITVSPSNFTVEGNPLKLTCVTESNPPAQVVWSKHLADGNIEHFIENNVLSIPHARFTDSGLYVCEVINLVTNKTEKATVDIFIQGTSLLEFNSVTSLCIGLEAADILIYRKLRSFPYVFRI